MGLIIPLSVVDEYSRSQDDSGICAREILPLRGEEIMEKVYVPYLNDAPATIEINGHTLVIVSKSSRSLKLDLSVVGGDSVREIELRDGRGEEAAELAKLAATVKGGVVMAPGKVRLSTMIKSLEQQLPWLQ